MKHICFILFFLLLVSCNKDRTLHVKAINAATGQPYSGLRFIVTEEKTGAFEEKYKTVYDGNLDNNGEAYAIVKIRKNRSYSIRCEEPTNTCYNKKISYSYAVEDDQNPTFLFEFSECAYLKFRYYNSNCFDANDHIEVTRVTNLDGYYGFNNPAIYNGCTDYTMDNFVEVPMGFWYFDWSVTKNGITSNFQDTIFIGLRNS